jgi:hypothetical protein
VYWNPTVNKDVSLNPSLSSASVYKQKKDNTLKKRANATKYESSTRTNRRERERREERGEKREERETRGEMRREERREEKRRERRDCGNEPVWLLCAVLLSRSAAGPSAL